MNYKRLIYLLISLVGMMGLSSCIMEDFQECPNDYKLKIVYDRNMLFTDAFGSRVKSVDIKVFDHISGREVYHFSEQGEALADEGYEVTLPIEPGRYDILCWGSMAEGDSFSYANPAPERIEHHNVLLKINDSGESDELLGGLFHGMLTDVEFIDNNDIGSMETQRKTLYLTNNTNRLNVVLHNLDNTELDPGDFTISISSANAEMAHDNSISARRKVSYRHWHISPITVDYIQGDEDDGENTSSGRTRARVQSALSAEFSLARLTPDGNSRLDVIRNSDGERIISVPLERNLLLYKGQYYSSMTDEEYLDRQDSFSMTFILDSNNNWSAASMIYIQDWATLPVQYQEW